MVMDTEHSKEANVSLVASENGNKKRLHVKRRTTLIGSHVTWKKANPRRIKSVGVYYVQHDKLIILTFPFRYQNSFYFFPNSSHLSSV
jgi:hypothetical protein